MGVCAVGSKLQHVDKNNILTVVGVQAHTPLKIKIRRFLLEKVVNVWVSFSVLLVRTP